MSGNYHVVGKNVQKLDGVKLVTGQPCFADDVQPRGMLHGRILGEPSRPRRDRGNRRLRGPGSSGCPRRADPPRHPARRHLHGGSESSGAFPLGSLHSRSQGAPRGGPGGRCRRRNASNRRAGAPADPGEVQSAAGGARPGSGPCGRAPPVVHDEPEITNVKDASRNLAGEIDVQVGNVEEGFSEGPRDRRRTSTACRGYSIAAWRPTCPSDTSTRTTGSSCGPARRFPSTPAGRWPRPFRSPRPASA